MSASVKLLAEHPRAWRDGGVVAELEAHPGGERLLVVLEKPAMPPRGEMHRAISQALQREMARRILGHAL